MFLILFGMVAITIIALIFIIFCRSEDVRVFSSIAFFAGIFFIFLVGFQIIRSYTLAESINKRYNTDYTNEEMFFNRDFILTNVENK